MTHIDIFLQAVGTILPAHGDLLQTTKTSEVVVIAGPIADTMAPCLFHNLTMKRYSLIYAPGLS